MSEKYQDSAVKGRNKVACGWGIALLGAFKVIISSLLLYLFEYPFDFFLFSSLDNGRFSASSH